MPVSNVGRVPLVHRDPFRYLGICFTCAWAGSCNYHNFLNSRVNPNKNYIFGTLTLRTIDWYINELILRGSGEEGGGAGGV